ncbi:MAG TPA: hypothetical protein HPP80_03115 [Rhodospirillaceae bacterium]|nr:hypothetical protein [Rhodospirillaceae bacterium]
MAVVSAKDVMAAVEQLRRDMQGQIAELRSALEAAQARQTTPAPAGGGAASKEVGSEILAILAATITAFLGKKVRIRSAKMLLTPDEIVNPWAQRGRVFIHASRNLPRRR